MFREIATGLYLQPSLLYQTNCVVARDALGVTCIDPGYFETEVLAARALFDRLAAAQPGLRVLALTHSDFDHIVGAPAFDDLQIATHAAWDAANEERARGVLRRFDAEHYIERSLQLRGAVRRDIRVEDGQELGAFQCWGAQGHTDDGLVLFHRPTNALIVGDYLSDCEFPFIYTSAGRYHAALERFTGLIRDLRPELLISQHGRPAAGSTEISRRLDESRAYLGALLSAAAGAADPEDAARRSEGAWRGAVPEHLWEQHVRNARIAVREAQGG